MTEIEELKATLGDKYYGGYFGKNKEGEEGKGFYFLYLDPQKGPLPHPRKMIADLTEEGALKRAIEYFKV